MFAIFPELLQQAEKGDIEAVAVLVRKYFGENQAYAPNLRVAELCGIVEITLNHDIQKAAARMEAWDAQGQFRIVVSLHPEIRSLREQNYILAQMLGHVFLDLQPKMAKGELQRSIFEKKTSPLRALLLNPKEIQPVDDFALALLLPKGMLKKALSSLSSKSDVAAFFNVELPLLECRLARIGYVTPEKARESSMKSAPVENREPRRDGPAEKNLPPRAAASSQKTPGQKSPAAPAGNSQAAPSPSAAGPAPTPTPTPARGKNEAPRSEQKNAPNPDLSSMARVNRSVAARTYKMEGERPEIAPAPQPSPGLERLRKLARKIDKSVDE